MNVAATLPFVGVQVDNTVLYTALAALIITIAVAVIWRSIGKGALVAIILLGVIVYLAMHR